MKIYLLMKDSEPMPELFTTLRPLCQYYNIPYYGLRQVNKPVLIDGFKYCIKEVRANKIKGRGRAFT